MNIINMDGNSSAALFPCSGIIVTKVRIHDMLAGFGKQKIFISGHQ